MYTHRQKQIDKILLAATILAAGLIATDAKAEAFASMPNIVGGVIVLTNDQLPACGDSAYIAYSTSPTNTTLYGCWYADKINVHIIWANTNRVRSYRISDFAVLEGKL